MTFEGLFQTKLFYYSIKTKWSAKTAALTSCIIFGVDGVVHTGTQKVKVYVFHPQWI